MKDMGLWNEADWIALIAVVVLGVFLAIPVAGMIMGWSKDEEQEESPLATP